MGKSKKFTPPSDFQISRQASQRLLSIQSEIDELLRDEQSTLNKLKNVRSTIQDLRDEERRLIRQEDPTGTLFEPDEEEPEKPEKPAPQPATAEKPEAAKATKKKKGKKSKKDEAETPQRPAVAKGGQGAVLLQPITDWLEFQPSKRLGVAKADDLVAKLGLPAGATVDAFCERITSWHAEPDEKLEPLVALALGQLRLRLTDAAVPTSQLQAIDSALIHLREAEWPDGAAVAEFEELMEFMAGELDEPNPEAEEAAAAAGSAA